MRSILACAMMVFVSSALAAEVVSLRPDATTATLYQSYRGFPNIALIVETRKLDLTAGDNVVRFDNVASTMIPQTVQVTGLPNPPRQSDFDYDLLDPGTILRKSIGTPAELILSPPKADEVHRVGTLVSDQGIVAFKDEAGVEVLGCGGPPARLRVEMLAGLRTKPSLSVRVWTANAGRYQVRLSYLAGRLSWRAAYIAKLAKDQHHLDLEGRIVLDNDTATSFDQVPTRFVAGEVYRLPGTSPPWIYPSSLRRDCWGTGRTSDPAADATGVVRGGAGQASPPMAAAAPTSGLTRDIAQESLSDLKLYRLEEPVRIAALQQKLFRFLARKAVQAEPVAVVSLVDYLAIDSQSARSMWRLRNTKASGLGMPLPRGAATLYAADGAFLGADLIPLDVAEGGQFELIGLPTGEILFDHRITAEGWDGNSRSRNHALTLKNTTARAVRVEVYFSRQMMTSIASGLPGSVLRNGAVVWATTLPARGTRRFTFVSLNAQ